LALTAALSAQNPSAAPTFEVASVKRNTGEPGPPVFDGSAFRQSGRLTVMNATVLMLLQVLYRDERPVDIQGGPSWIATDRFDIAAVGEPQSDAEVAPGRTLPRLSAMMKSLLADRFKFRSHIERNDQQGYVLIAVNPRQPGAKLGAAKTECVPQCGTRESGPKGVTGTAMNMDELASALARLPGIGAVVENRTGIEGRYDIRLAVEDTPPVSIPEQGARVIATLEDQLGLALRSQLTTREVLVIDHIERPSHN